MNAQVRQNLGKRMKNNEKGERIRRRQIIIIKNPLKKKKANAKLPTL